MGIKCENCDNYNHQFLNCPYIKFTTNEYKLIK